MKRPVFRVPFVRTFGHIMSFFRPVAPTPSELCLILIKL
jgi:hypothetical protein